MLSRVEVQQGSMFFLSSGASPFYHRCNVKQPCHWLNKTKVLARHMTSPAAKLPAALLRSGSRRVSRKTQLGSGLPARGPLGPLVNVEIELQHLARGVYLCPSVRNGNIMIPHCGTRRWLARRSLSPYSLLLESYYIHGCPSGQLSDAAEEYLTLLVRHMPPPCSNMKCLRRECIMCWNNPNWDTPGKGGMTTVTPVTSRYRRRRDTLDVGVPRSSHPLPLTGGTI